MNALQNHDCKLKLLEAVSFKIYIKLFYFTNMSFSSPILVLSVSFVF